MTTATENLSDQARDVVSLHIPRTDWRLIRGILFTRQAEALQGSRHRREEESASLSMMREGLRLESAELKRILDDLDSQT